MGYQESYLYLGNKFYNNHSLDDVLKILEKHNIRQENDLFCSCSLRIKLNQNISTDENKRFKKGDEFLYITGERDGQRGVNDFFERCNKINYTLKEKMLLSKVRLIPTENMPSDEIFYKKGFAEIRDLADNEIDYTKDSEELNILADFDYER